MTPGRRPGTPSLLRVLNDRAALELLLAQGPLTRTRLGELTGLSKVTASQMMERLEQRGLVVRVGEVAGSRGPHAQLYAVDPSSAYVVGVEIDADRVIAACADVTGAVVGRCEQPTRDVDDPVGTVSRTVRGSVLAAQVDLSLVRRTVLGTPGLIDPATGEIAYAQQLPRWLRGLSAALREEFHIPVVFENDVNLAAVAEARLGAARGVTDFALVWAGLGLGVGIMLGGQLHRGSHGAAGEIGYLPVEAAPSENDESCCANGGAPRPVRPAAGLHRLAALPAVRAVAQDAGFRGSGATGVRAAAAAGRAGQPVLDEVARRLALGVASMCLVLDPPLVVLSGDIGQAGGPALAERVETQVARLVPATPRVVVGEITREPVLAGALHIALGAVRDEIFGEIAAH